MNNLFLGSRGPLVGPFIPIHPSRDNFSFSIIFSSFSPLCSSSPCKKVFSFSKYFPPVPSLSFFFFARLISVSFLIRTSGKEYDSQAGLTILHKKIFSLSKCFPPIHSLFFSSLQNRYFPFPNTLLLSFHREIHT